MGRYKNQKLFMRALNSALANSRARVYVDGRLARPTYFA